MIVYAEGPVAKFVAELDGTSKEVEKMSLKTMGVTIEDNTFYMVRALAQVSEKTLSQVVRDLLRISIDQVKEQLDDETLTKLQEAFAEIAQREFEKDRKEAS